MCRKHERRCPVALVLREEAMQEWCEAESFEQVQNCWRRLGGKVVLHRYGREWFSLLARHRHGDPLALEMMATRMQRRSRA